MTRPAPPHHTFHIDGLRLKHIENSVHGLYIAKRQGCVWWDGDNRHDADGISWNTHSDRLMLHDGYRDPHHPRMRLRPISHMHQSQILRLRTKDGYEVHKSVPQVLKALSIGLKVEFEVKDRKYHPKFFAHMYRAIEAAGFDPDDVWVKGYPKFYPSVAAAHRIFTTVLLTHGDRVPRHMQEGSNFHRGPVIWV